MFSLCFRRSKVFPTEENDSHMLLMENEEKSVCPITHKTRDKILTVFEVADGQDIFYDAIALYKWVLKRQLEFLPPTFPHNRKIIGPHDLEFLKHTYDVMTDTRYITLTLVKEEKEKNGLKMKRGRRSLYHFENNDMSIVYECLKSKSKNKNKNNKDENTSVFLTPGYELVDIRGLDKIKHGYVVVRRRNSFIENDSPKNERAM